MKQSMRHTVLCICATLLLVFATPDCKDGATDDSTVCDVDGKQADETPKASDAPESAVVELNDELFARAIAHNATVLVLFCGKTTEKCASFTKRYEAAAKKLKSKGSETILATVDTLEQGALAGAAGVPADQSPTLRFFKRGMVYDYSGRMSGKGITKWVLEREGDLVRNITTQEELTALTKSAEFALVGFYKDVNSSYAEALRTYADTYTDASMDQFAFGIVTSPELADELSVEDRPSALLFRQANRNPEDNEFESVIKGLQLQDDSPATLEKLVDMNRFAFVGEMTEQNHKEYQMRRLPFVWLFVDYSDKDYKKYVDMLKPIGEGLEGKVSVVYTNGAKYGKFMKHLGGNIKMPGIVILDDREEKGLDKAPKKYRFKGEFEPSNIEKFFKEWDEETLPVYMRTEAIPTGDAKWNDGVFVTVGLNYEDVVTSDKFVMMKLYSSEKNRRDGKVYDERVKEYKNLATHFKDHGDVIIAQIDVTRNDVGQLLAPILKHSSISIKNLPTLILYPRQEKLDEENSLVNEPVQYEGVQSAEEITRWINAKRFPFMTKDPDAPTEEQAVDIEDAPTSQDAIDDIVDESTDVPIEEAPIEKVEL